MNKYLRSIIILFLFIVSYEWVIHGLILQGLYEDSHNLWRSEDGQQARLHILFLSQAMSAFVAYLLLSRSDSTSMSDFIVFGAFIGLLAGAWRISMYVVVPYSWLMVACWIAFDMIKYTIVAWLFYRLNHK